MKLYSIKNLFEFRDFTFQGALENLIVNAGNLQGLGLPDICVICRKQTSGMFKTTSDQSSAFHLIQGYCAPSQAEISAYIHQLMMSQEKDTNSKLFGNDVIIFKITYILYDIFTKTYLVCQFEQPDDGLTQFKTYGIESNRNITQLSKFHWEGAYISSVLRAIDVKNKLPCVGRFFNQLNICNPIKLVEFIKKLLNQLQSQDNKFQDLNPLKSKNDFPDIDDALYFLNWPIYILVKYLEECGHLDILIKTIDSLEDNIIVHLIKGILYYKIQDYSKCLQQIVQIHQDPIWFSFPYYLQAKAFIKLNKFENAFVLLQELVVDCYENPLIWIAFSELFRKQQIYHVSLLFLNRASRFPLKNSARSIIDFQNLTNYKILSQNKNLQSPAHLETYYKLIHPQVVEKVESFAQISSFPILDTILVRPRQPFKKDFKTLDQLVKVMMRAEQRISVQTFDLLINNDLLNCENCANSLIKEILKLFNAVGQNKIKSLIAQIFYQKPKIQKKIDQIYDPSEFSLNLIQKKNQLLLNVSSISCTNKSLMNPRLSEEFDEDDSDEEKPNFLKPQIKMNKSFDFGSIRQYQTPQGRPKSPVKFISAKKKNQPFKKANTIIVENAFESVESERQNQRFQKILNDSIAQAPVSEMQQQKNYIYSLSQYLTQNVNQQQQAQMVDQLMRRKEQIVSQFAETIDTIIKVQIELDQLFYPSTEKQSQGMSINGSQVQSPNSNAPIFKSNLKKTLQNKTHLSRQAEFKEYYLVPPQELEDLEAKDKFCSSQLKSESYFLFRCAKLSKMYKKKELAIQIMSRIQNKVISVQVELFLLKMYESNPKQLIRQIQKTLCDFHECGINQIQQVPLWIEIIIAKLAKQLGANQILALLSNSDTDFTFYLIKRVILLGENLA